MSQGSGSPPRVWGQQHGAVKPRTGDRFTPTRVGTTDDHVAQFGHDAVHPHACGDNWLFDFESELFTGSPPRVWGQPDIGRLCRRVVRFTPTRVGTTRVRARARATRSVHPHACGDNTNLRPSGPAANGSPPRVWGQRGLVCLISLIERFTPTRVGTTPPRCRRCPAHPVHPHACGDNVTAPITLAGRAGSPPRVWGQQGPVGEREPGIRFTPTRVGTTAWRRQTSDRRSVHPHACGDNRRPCSAIRP